MREQEMLSRSNFKYRNHLFKYSFLVFQLVFSSMLLFYILRKTDIGMQLVNRFLH